MEVARGPSHRFHGSRYQTRARARSSQPNPEPKLPSPRSVPSDPPTCHGKRHDRAPEVAGGGLGPERGDPGPGFRVRHQRPPPAPARRHAPVSNPRLPPGNRTGRPPLAPRQSAASRLHGTGAGAPGPSVRAGRPSRSKGSDLPCQDHVILSFTAEAQQARLVCAGYVSGAGVARRSPIDERAQPPRSSACARSASDARSSA